MDKYTKECEACWCEQAQEMRHKYDVWFNCNTCPFAECYEPDTREQYLSGVTEREAEWMQIEEAIKLRKMEDEKYKNTPYFQEQVMFADSIRQKVENNVLLTPEEFERALAFGYRDREILDFFSLADLVRYQISLLGYSGGAEIIINYIEELEDY